MIPIPPAVAIKARRVTFGISHGRHRRNDNSSEAATVAGPEPDIAAKKHATSTHTRASPPLTCPTKDWANAISLVEIPAFSIMFPAKMKNGYRQEQEFADGSIIVKRNHRKPQPGSEQRRNTGKAHGRPNRRADNYTEGEDQKHGYSSHFSSSSDFFCN